MKKLLHVGCSHSRKENTTSGFNNSQWEEIRLDIDSSVSPDVVGSMTDMSAMATNSVDAIFSSHNIEHLYPHEVPDALSEFYRVLKPDGFVIVTCPDLQSVCALVAQDILCEPAYMSKSGPISPLDMLYGHRTSMAQGNLYMSHRCGFTYNVLTDIFLQAGFKNTGGYSRPEFFDIWVVASKSARTNAELQQLASLHFPAQPV